MKNDTTAQTYAVFRSKAEPNIIPGAYKTFSCATWLSMEFILLINGVKMPTTVGILTFMSRINTSYEWFKARKYFIFQYCSFMSN